MLQVEVENEAYQMEEEHIQEVVRITTLSMNNVKDLVALGKVNYMDLAVLGKVNNIQVEVVDHERKKQEHALDDDSVQEEAHKDIHACAVVGEGVEEKNETGC